MAYILLKFYKHVHNIHLEGTVSQMFYLGPSFDFMTKNGSLHNSVVYGCSKFCVSKFIITDRAWWFRGGTRCSL